MTEKQDPNPYYGRTSYRVIQGTVGAIVCAIGIYALFFGVVGPLGRIGVGGVFAILGGEAVWASIQSRTSWLSSVSLFF